MERKKNSAIANFAQVGDGLANEMEVSLIGKYTGPENNKVQT